jgi:hypothetical protein
MRARNEIRGLDEIVRDIIEKLDIGSDELAMAVTAIEVRGIIQAMRTLGQLRAPLWGYQRDNLESIEPLQTQIERLQKALRSMPAVALALVFSPEETGQGDHIPSTAVQQRAVARLRGLTGVLVRLSGRCEQLIASPPGKHKSLDWQKERAAGEARDLLERHCKKVTKSSSSTSLFRETASLLYEGVTGEHGVDLERACRAALETDL